MRRNFMGWLVLVQSLVLASLAFAAPPPGGPEITGIGGWSDGVGIEDGRWNGQPEHAPDTASNRYVGHLAVDCYAYPEGARNPYFWTIQGRGFGEAKGTVAILRRPSGKSEVSLEVLSWSDTGIKVLATAPHGFTTEEAAIVVLTAPNARHPKGRASPPHEEAIVGMVKSRGYGQCTWFVAHTRVGAGLDVPPRAYAETATLPAVGQAATDYQPAQWDCLSYGKNHVAIISSEPRGARNRDGSIEWTFTVGEMNAAWDEAPSSSARSYKISAPDRTGRRTVLVGIGTNASRRWVATGYFR